VIENGHEPAQATPTVYAKNESPGGFPFDPSVYLDMPFIFADAVEWKLIQNDVVLASTTTKNARKLAVPKFDSVRRPDLHKPSELVVADQTFPVSVLDAPFNLARSATATASSSEPDYTAAGAINGKASGYPHGKHHEWASAKEKAGASIKLEWSEPQTIDAILLYDRPNLTDHVTGAMITFDDGSAIDVGELPNDGRKPVELNFPPKTIRSLTFKVTKVSDATENAGISEIAVYQPAAK
jgi:hypothetical protein